MPMIKIDGKDYDLDSLPEAAQGQLKSLQFVDSELARLAAQTAVYKTARIGYFNALKKALEPGTSAPPPPSEPSIHDTIKF